MGFWILFSLLTSNRSFDDPWIGHETLISKGLHGHRMKAAAFCNASRRWQVAWRRNRHAQSMRRDGYVAITDFLPQDAFLGLRDEVLRTVEHVHKISPPRVNLKAGFQPQEPKSWGYDRFDGGTLNRFIRNDPQAMPELDTFCRNGALSDLSRIIVGLPVRASNVRIYETINGDEAENHDIQKDFHRDTFFSSMKFWYFIDEVTEANGPFVYVPGSHKLTAQRIHWENRMARAAVARKQQTGSAGGGAFRIAEDELGELGLSAPKALTVPANTMVIADTLGFHRRGDAEPGARRISIYSSNRPMPFVPFGL